MASAEPTDAQRREAALGEYRKKLVKHKEVDTKVRSLRDAVKELKRDYDKTEDDLKALQSVGQIIGEVLRQLDEERFIVKASSGPRYVVGCRNKIEKSKLVQGTRVSLDMTTLTIMRHLPREVDPVVFHMKAEDPGNVQYSSVGGLNDQIRELREVIDDPGTQYLYIVQEFCEAGAVMTEAEYNTPLDAEAARSYFRDVVKGLEYLFFQRIIHRDIKP